ncbi:Uu.00g063550.m01.CDS01 [Anthostomella pinea]|uniref:Peroxisomal membrane protein PEX14 n=1 Tax=Anthostomella pinea TaxID=933095 RepID=A0AAI8YN17_9PEZI|nr:Uu.00g063550.m01.CDS01 [Anthostomella pinea]
MADKKKPSIPAWQQDQPAPGTDTGTDREPTETTLDHARKFLTDVNVRDASTEKKREFLEQKGFDKTQVQVLLDEVEAATQASARQPESASAAASDNAGQRTKAKPAPEANTTVASSTFDAPPIITYPEFLTTSPRPPPLLTPSRLANILSVAGSAWTLMYGVARFVVNPMVEDLNEKRSDYYSHVNDKLAILVEKLEGAASEVPYKNGKPLRSKTEEGAYADDESTFSDPSEMFYRDVGVQTSPPASLPERTSSNSADATEKPADAQARKLARIAASVRELTLMRTQEAERTADLRTTLQGIRDAVDKLASPPMPDYASIHGCLGYGRSSEPDDEFKKTKDAIRSVKGVLLSARSFPTATATAK